MVFRLTRIWVPLGVLIGIWGLSAIRRSDERAWVRPLGTPVGPVKILGFYASVGSVTMGQKARLCYGVENAKTVRISPPVGAAYPSLNHCLEIYPERTTHYLILAEGYDGRVATQSLTLPVLPVLAPQRPLNYAAVRFLP